MDYYRDSVSPWWSGLVEFADDANVPPAYSEFHSALVLLARIGTDRAQAMLDLELTVDAVTESVADHGRLKGELSESPLLELARVECGLDQRWLDDPELALDLLGRTSQAAVDVAPGIVDALGVGNLAVRFCQAADAIPDIGYAFNALWTEIGWINAVPPSSLADDFDTPTFDHTVAIAIASVATLCAEHGPAFESFLG